MASAIARRALVSVPVLWLVLTLIFVGFHLIPGDPAEAILAQQAANNSNFHITPDKILEERQLLGLNQPLPNQYWDFLTHAVHFDFGLSYTTQRPVWTEIGERFPYTAELALTAWLLSILIGVPLGILAAWFSRSFLGPGITSLAVIGMSLPVFWLGTMLAFVFGVELHLLPIADAGDWRHLVLPAVTLSLVLAARLARQTRASLVDILASDYVRTAYAKGLPRRRVILVHSLRNALPPLVTVLGLEIAGLLGGAIIVENIFNWPGLGTLALGAVDSRDYPVIEGTTFLFAVILVAANLLVDLLYRWLDPRVEVAI